MPAYTRAQTQLVTTATSIEDNMAKRTDTQQKLDHNESYDIPRRKY
jgi:hypothetical protein